MEFEQPLLSSFFPVVFRNGAQWTTFTGKCGRCDKDIANENLRGTVVKSFEQVFVVEAQGFCPSCVRLTPFRYRLHAGMGVSGISPRTGQWARWKPKRAWWRRLLSWF